MAFGKKDRSARLQSLENNEFDLLIVGGGITGVATARDAAMRGFRVACVEKDDFASGTSSRSSKLIHGGLRYLEQANFKLVFEGTHERATLRAVAPHLVRPIPFLFPVFDDAKRGIRVVGFGLWLYDTLAGSRRYGRHKRHKADKLEELEPGLRQEGLTGGAVYYDCMTDDARLALENAISAHEQGAVMLNHVAFVEGKQNEEGRLVGGVVRDECTGKTIEVKFKTLVRCAGPWTDDVLQRSGSQEDPMIRTSKGVHIVFAHERLPVKHAIVMSAVSDRRVVFAIPRGRVTLVGTTDTDFNGDPDNVHITREDVDYLMETLAYFFPDTPLSMDDIQATYAGLRPLVRDDSDSPYDVSREHTVFEHSDGSVTIGGGKYTTYRRMADDVLRMAMKTMGLSRKERPKCETKDALLPGADGLAFPDEFEDSKKRLVEEGMPTDIASYLVDVYGARHTEIAQGNVTRIIESLPCVWAEIDHSVQNESAMTIDDVLVRRLPLYYEAKEQGLECLDAVAMHMQALLGWTDSEKQAQIETYKEVVALSRRWAD